MTQKQIISMITNGITSDISFFSREYVKYLKENGTKADRLYAWGNLCQAVKVYNQLNGGHDPKKNKKITSAYEQVQCIENNQETVQ